MQWLELIIFAIFLTKSCHLCKGHYYPYYHNQKVSVAYQESSTIANNDKSTTDGFVGIKYNPYNKHHTGRHVCTLQRNSTHPVKTKQAQCRPIYKKYFVKCGNQMCAGVKLVYETYYKDVIITRNNNEISYVCCPGWTQITNRSHGCNKPICPQVCFNGGKCVKPGVCNCLPPFTGKKCEIEITPVSTTPKYYCPRTCENGGTCTAKALCLCKQGFRGLYCEKDVNECVEYKPCDQLCYNTYGSYTCQCKENFILQPDGQTCRKENYDGTTFEARDLEFETLDKRLHKIETMMDKYQQNEVTKDDIDRIYSNINSLKNTMNDIKNQIDSVVDYKKEMYVFKAKLSQIEQKTGRFDDFLTKYDKIRFY